MSEASSEDESQNSFLIQVTCDMDQPDLLQRYYSAVNRLRTDIMRFHESRHILKLETYELVPVLIAENVDGSVLEQLPTLVGDMHAKCVVRGTRLFITNLSTGDAHGAGVAELVGQARAWSGSRFMIKTAKNFTTGKGDTTAPDLVLEVPISRRAPKAGPSRVVIVELEVSNRSIVGMRQDFVHYFDEATVHSVVGIKMLAGDRRSPCQRCLAVQWTRFADGTIEPIEIRDFGLLKISAFSSALFSRAMPPGLPPVARERWVNNRHVPVPLATLPVPPPPNNNAAFVLAAAQYITAMFEGTFDTVLYGGVMPTIRFGGDILTTFLHNLPPGAPALQDFVLDLGHLFYEVQRTATTN